MSTVSVQQSSVPLSSARSPASAPSSAAGSPPGGFEGDRRRPVIGDHASAGASLELIERSRTGLLSACHAEAAGERYTLAHLAALRAAAALLAARGQLGRRGGRRSAWENLAAVAPELTEWAEFFVRSGHRRQAIERGVEVATREADDLVRQAEVFLELVLGQLGLPIQPSVTRRVVPVTRP